ncbi:MAG: hypothetical protein AAGD07_26340, partial [Planctomycetota bacterium]
MILTIAAIFAGIGVFLATMYSVSQILLLEGRARLAHAASVVTILIVMACLMERWNETARIAAIPMLGAAFWTLVVEPRWYRVFPLLVMVFALLIILGYVVLV